MDKPDFNPACYTVTPAYKERYDRMEEALRFIANGGGSVFSTLTTQNMMKIAHTALEK